LKKIRITMSGACRSVYTEMLAVSHQWERPDNLDANEAYLASLREHLIAHREIGWSWMQRRSWWTMSWMRKMKSFEETLALAVQNLRG
jgi:hypothetical protein